MKRHVDNGIEPDKPTPSSLGHIPCVLAHALLQHSDQRHVNSIDGIATDGG